MDADPDFDRPRPKPPPKRGLRLIHWLLCIGIVGVLIGLFLPANRSAGPLAQRVRCAGNLRQIALALLSYERTYGTLPPARTEDASGRALHSWRTLILPFLDQQELYRRVDLTKPWDDKANAEVSREMPSAFRCPAGDTPPGTTTFLAIVGPNACFLASKPRHLAEITNDHAETLMIIEVGQESSVPWMAPTDADESLVLGLNPKTRLNHRGGMNAAYVDGSVQFLEAGETAAERREMIAIAGRERKAGGAEGPPQSPDKGD